MNFQIKLGIIHGSMDKNDKEKVLNNFLNNIRGILG